MHWYLWNVTKNTANSAGVKREMVVEGQSSHMYIFYVNVEKSWSCLLSQQSEFTYNLKALEAPLLVTAITLCASTLAAGGLTLESTENPVRLHTDVKGHHGPTKPDFRGSDNTWEWERICILHEFTPCITRALKYSHWVISFHHKTEEDS